MPREQRPHLDIAMHHAERGRVHMHEASQAMIEAMKLGEIVEDEIEDQVLIDLKKGLVQARQGLHTIRKSLERIHRPRTAPGAEEGDLT